MLRCALVVALGRCQIDSRRCCGHFELLVDILTVSNIVQQNCEHTCQHRLCPKPAVNPKPLYERVRLGAIIVYNPCYLVRGDPIIAYGVGQIQNAYENTQDQ